ncbi:hypothetical protein ACFV1W_03460 [Kitasatospora sp. NPDC059648]|uniref:hypothetical protein n=1 Tax=Kitasatospora sp. NPDC059648 TaxID=3346894 RepID=UPI0036A83648
MTYAAPATGEPSRGRFEAVHPLLLMGVGLACSWWSADEVRAVQRLLSKCQDSDGAPGYVLPLGWTGVALSALATFWAVWIVVAAFRRRSMVRAGFLHGVLVALLPVLVVAVAVQAVSAGDNGDYTHHRHHYCAG